MGSNPVQGSIGKVITVEDLERIFGQQIQQGSLKYLAVIDPVAREQLQLQTKLLKTIVAHLEIMNGDVISIDDVELK